MKGSLHRIERCVMKKKIVQHSATDVSGTELMRNAAAAIAAKVF